MESASGGTAFLTSEQTLLQQAAMQGQTVFAAAGDSGSSDCYGDTTSNANLPSVDDPASQPYVIGVGGTSIGASSETVWNDSSTNQGGAGGGGVSAVECMPDYQLQSTTTGETIPQGVVNSDSVKSATCSTGYRREVPDVSADADPDTGYVIYWTPDTAGATGSWLGGLGGTSAAAPLWAAVAALIDASPFCSYYGSTDRSSGGMLPNDATGLLYNSLYYIAASPYYSFALYDVTHGNNYFTPAGTTDNPDELYPATAGYDMASGLGTPSVAYADNFVPGLAALVCGLTATKLTTTGITRLTPDLGPSTRHDQSDRFRLGIPAHKRGRRAEDRFEVRASRLQDQHVVHRHHPPHKGGHRRPEGPRRGPHDLSCGRARPLHVRGRADDHTGASPCWAGQGR